MARSEPAETVREVPDPRPAPPDLEALRRFVNSDDRYHGVDRLLGEERSAWAPRALGHPVHALDEPAWRRLADLRDRVRAVIAGDTGAGAALAETASRYPVSLGSDGPDDLVAVRDDQESRLAASVLVALHRAAVDGRLPRLRLCQRPDCQWCYYDGSKNGSARWCSADPCGDVMKARAYRSRRRDAG